MIPLEIVWAYITGAEMLIVFYYLRKRENLTYREFIYVCVLCMLLVPIPYYLIKEYY
jgi:hypothetical protein